jgi:catechol 2,3-dioxygenase-like lactoylglutathione lyase family enzyme
MDDDLPRNRRQFLTTASAATLVTLAHGHLAWAAPTPEASKMTGAKAAQRILGLRLLTAAPLEKMKAFYHRTLGLPVLKENANELTIEGGSTPITFLPAKPDQGNPFYHFAFNIPENKLLDARAWQLERTELLPIFPRLRDPSYPDDVVHFSHWNAHSVFFLDPAGNVLEYIARHDLNNSADGPFSTGDILYASEIAFIVDDVSALSSGLQGTFELDQYRQGSDTFRALGDELGLLLVFQRGRNMSMGYAEPRLADVFPIVAQIRGATATKYSPPNLPFEVTSR